MRTVALQGQSRQADTGRARRQNKDLPMADNGDAPLYYRLHLVLFMVFLLLTVVP